MSERINEVSNRLTFEGALIRNYIIPFGKRFYPDVCSLLFETFDYLGGGCGLSTVYYNCWLFGFAWFFHVWH